MNKKIQCLMCGNFYPSKTIARHLKYKHNLTYSVEGLKVWEHGKLPKRLHYGENPRTLDLIVVADSSYNVVMKEKRASYGGNHGFDNFNTDMHAIFYAYGQAFKENYSQPTFNNIDLYPLIANILDLKPAKVDGKLEHVKSMLK